MGKRIKVACDDTAPMKHFLKGDVAEVLQSFETLSKKRGVGGITKFDSSIVDTRKTPVVNRSVCRVSRT